MKKFTLTTLLALAVLALSHANVFAADTLPATSVWVTPASATPGSAIMLNALVYNNTSQDVTATVTFTNSSVTPVAIIGTVKQLVTTGSAKTISQPWIMPTSATVVTVAITSAVNNKNVSVPSLVGPLGTVTVGSNVITPVVDGITFPGSSQISAWLSPFFANIEAYRVKQANYFTALRDTTKAQLGITPAGTTVQPDTTTNTSDGLPPIKLDSPTEYFNLIYSSAFAALFSNMLIFYIAIVLLLLLIIRFIVNLIF